MNNPILTDNNDRMSNYLSIGNFAEKLNSQTNFLDGILRSLHGTIDGLDGGFTRAVIDTRVREV